MSGDDRAGPGNAGASWRGLSALAGTGGVLVLSGAGLSTESGIPDYRGPDGRRRVTPMTISQFRGSAEARQRYWARSFVGWPRFAAAQPNQGHRAVAALQAAGLVVGLITQNVDGLHQAAGSDDVIELHGALARVRCLRCQELMARSDVQDQLRELNPDVGGGAAGVLPDGDVALPDELAAEFHGPRCPVCHSDLVTPDVVFFGDSVPEARVRRCYSLVEAAASVVVLGSSLAVMSGFRFVRHAASLGRPVAIVTKGDTRADGLASIRLRAELGPALATLAEELGTTHGSGARWSSAEARTSGPGESPERAMPPVSNALTADAAQL